MDGELSLPHQHESIDVMRLGGVPSLKFDNLTTHPVEIIEHAVCSLPLSVLCVEWHLLSRLLLSLWKSPCWNLNCLLCAGVCVRPRRRNGK